MVGYGEGAHINVIIRSAQLFPRSAMAAPSQETVVAGPPSNLAPCRGKVRPAPPARGATVPWHKTRLTRTVINMIMSGRPANRERADPPLPPSLACPARETVDMTTPEMCDASSGHVRTSRRHQRSLPRNKKAFHLLKSFKKFIPRITLFLSGARLNIPKYIYKMIHPFVFLFAPLTPMIAHHMGRPRSCWTRRITSA